MWWVCRSSSCLERIGADVWLDGFPLLLRERHRTLPDEEDRLAVVLFLLDVRNAVDIDILVFDLDEHGSVL